MAILVCCIFVCGSAKQNWAHFAAVVVQLCQLCQLQQQQPWQQLPVMVQSSGMLETFVKLL